MNPVYFPQGYPLWVAWRDEESDTRRVSRVIGWQIQTGRSSPVLVDRVLPAVLPGGIPSYAYFEDHDDAVKYAAR